MPRPKSPRERQDEDENEGPFNVNILRTNLQIYAEVSPLLYDKARLTLYITKNRDGDLGYCTWVRLPHHQDWSFEATKDMEDLSDFPFGRLEKLEVVMDDSRDMAVWKDFEARIKMSYLEL